MRLIVAMASLLLLNAAAPNSVTPAPSKPKVTKSVEDTKAAEILETTKIEPELTYRMAYLDMRQDSAFHKEEHQDYLDQLYLNLRFFRDRDLRNEVVIEPTIRTPRGNPGGQVETVIEQGYVRFALGKSVSVTAGRKAEFDGSGFVTNPSDLLNEDRDQFDPLAQKAGKNFTRIAYKTGPAGVSVGFIPNAGNSARTGKLWLQGSVEAWDTDIKVQETAQDSDKVTLGLSVSRFFGDFFELHYDGRHQSRQRSAAQQEERKFSAYQYEDQSMYQLVGSRLIVASRRSLIAEVIQNQSGLDSTELENYHHSIEALSNDDKPKTPPQRIIGRHYGFIAFQDEATLPKTLLAVSALVNSDDKSVYGTLTGKYSLSPITSVEFSPTFFRGKKYSEFGELPFASSLNLIFRGKF